MARVTNSVSPVLQEDEMESYSNLHEAIKGNKLTAVKQILQSPYANVNERNAALQTPLHAVCQSGNLEIAQLLLSKNVDINAVDNIGYTPLHYAISTTSYELIQLLLTNPKINVNIRSKDATSILHILIKSPCTSENESAYKHVFQKVIDKGHDLNLQNRITGDSLLHEAVTLQNYIAVHFLLANQCDVNALNREGESAIFHAVKVNDVHMVNLLCYYKAKVNITSKTKKTLADIVCSNDVAAILARADESAEGIQLQHLNISTVSPPIKQGSMIAPPSYPAPPPPDGSFSGSKILSPMIPIISSASSMRSPSAPIVDTPSRNMMMGAPQYSTPIQPLSTSELEILSSSIQTYASNPANLPNFQMMTYNQVLQYYTYVESQISLTNRYLACQSPANNINNYNYNVNYNYNYNIHNNNGAGSVDGGSGSSNNIYPQGGMMGSAYNNFPFVICNNCKNSVSYAPNILTFACNYCQSVINVQHSS